MSDKYSYPGKPPKSAYEILMEKKKHLSECDETVWFTNDNCEICKRPIFTNGKLSWCGSGCIQNAKSTFRKDDKDYMGFISDLIR